MADSGAGTAGNLDSSVRTCFPGAGATGSPQTIEEAVTLINSLPKPTSVACFLESLDRPLNVTLTNNAFSAQPATDDENPRILIVNGKLTMTAAIKGNGRDLIEFGYQTTDTKSIKAEIEFPIVEDVLPQAPYVRIQQGGGTSCGLCHTGETSVQSVTVANAFESQILKPNPSTKVDLLSLKNQATVCDSLQDRTRCDLLEALFGHGDVRDLESQ